MVSVRLKKKGADRWKEGHPWIYQVDVEVPKGVPGGEIVKVVDHRGYLFGQALYSKASKIALRWLSWDDRPIDEAFFKERLRAADALRQKLYPGQTTYRVVHGEADLLPGLVVDRYGDYLSLQFLHAGTDSRKDMWLRILREHFNPKAIVGRNDVAVRVLEALKQERGVLFGEVPPTVRYHEGDVGFDISLIDGQKTGAFLDQRENHLMAQKYAEGECLDCFSYAGGFALQMAKKAKSVLAIEISEHACGLIRKNAESNALGNVTALCANAFDVQRDMLDEGRRFDTIVIDPPSFAKNKDAIEGAVRGYKELNLRAMQLLNPGGTLITSSCTYHVDEARFEAMLDSAAADAKRRVQILERRGPAQDHPVLLNLRETRYLKCFVLKVH